MPGIITHSTEGAGINYKCSEDGKWKLQIYIMYGKDNDHNNNADENICSYNSEHFPDLFGFMLKRLF